MVYIRERHPNEKEAQPTIGPTRVSIPDPQTLAERTRVAREFAAQFKVSLPVLVDTIDDRVEAAYAGMPDRIYVIDAQGKVAYKGGKGPSGFHVWEVPPVLDKLLGVSLAGTLSFPPDRGPARSGDTGPGDGMRERLTTMLGRFGLSERDSRRVLQALEKKQDAYRSVMDSRRALLAAAREREDVARALLAYEHAQKRYSQAVEKIDRELDAALGYSKKPELRATLTALGLIGSPAVPPMSGLMTGMDGLRANRPPR